MEPEPIYAPVKGEWMRVACFMSGSGTNARKIIERSLSPDSRYEVVLTFTDVRDDRLKRSGEKRCRARDIAEEHGIAHECVDIRDFYRSRGRKRTDLSLRPEFDRMVVEKIEPYDIDLIALAGYMSITTEPLLERYGGRMLNVHPADLSIMEGEERKYVGIHVVSDAILAREKELRASTHVVREKVDYGEVLVISEPMPVTLPAGVDLEALKEDKGLLGRVVDGHQDMLKERGDWIIYPLTIQMIAEGRFALDSRGNVYLDGEPTVSGLRL
ncbi:MAG: formyltransferase family protein [Candidatus Bathyarchaeota archaeon]|nr:formyltransferase family protein [Candidatus Bathyarchaeota archaeon]